MYACPHDLLHNTHIQGKQHRSIVVKKRCCSQRQPTPPFQALPAGFLTTSRQFPATASFAVPVSDFTRSLICPTTFQAREARSLRSPAQNASRTAVEALQAQFPIFPMFSSQASWNQLLSINLPFFLRLFESVLHALQSLCMPAHMTFCTTCTSKESNTSINRGEEEMLKPMTTNASFRSIASWLSDNIASVSRNSFLCRASF